MLKSISLDDATMREIDRLNEYKDNLAKLKSWVKMTAYYKQYQQYFQNVIATKFLKYDIDLILYDETEYFQDWNHPEFNYPYTQRKNVLSSFKVALDIPQTVEKKDYSYQNTDLKL